MRERKNHQGFRRIGWLPLALIIVLLIWRFLPHAQKSNGQCRFDHRLDAESLEYVPHATCRMKCRDVSEDLVEKVYREGSINCEKSDPAGRNSRGNPRWALERTDGSRGKVRVIIEEDDGIHKVITVIRLDEEDRCECS